MIIVPYHMHRYLISRKLDEVGLEVSKDYKLAYPYDKRYPRRVSEEIECNNMVTNMMDLYWDTWEEVEYLDNLIDEFIKQKSL